MPPRRSPAARTNASHFTRVFLALLLVSANLSLASNAQQKYLTPSINSLVPPSSSFTKPHNTQLAAPRNEDVRAIATLAPAKGSAPLAVRAPSPATGSPTGGLSSRLPARSLQDWDVEDFVLLATVDGMIHARDRETGAPRWAVEADRPMVETIYHKNNNTESSGHVPSDFIWIVEPSQDGSLYGYTPGSPMGMQKLGLTVRQLVEDLSPYSSSEPPVVYTGEKRNTLYTVDAATGKILKVFSAGGSAVIDEGSCRRLDSLEYLDDDECGTTGTLTLARTEYVVGIQASDTGQPICTIKYFEWGPNHRDKDLYNQYSSSKDNRYVYSIFDGRVLALDHFDDDSQRSIEYSARPMYRQKFPSPVAQVFDVARPVEAPSRDVPLIILPQPRTPTIGAPTLSDEADRIFVNCTEAGSWYALSEFAYPLVTDGAATARCSQRDFSLGGYQELRRSDPQFRKTLVGVHSISHDNSMASDTRAIPGQDALYTIEGPKDSKELESPPEAIPPAIRAPATETQSWFAICVSIIAVVIVTIVVGRQTGIVKINAPQLVWQKPISINMPNKDIDVPSALVTPQIEPTEFNGGATSEEAPKKVVKWADTDGQTDNEGDGAVTEGEELEQDGAQANADSAENADGQTPSKKKKKAHRGKRGGRKLAEKKALTDALNGTSDPNMTVDDSDGVIQVGKNVSVTPDAVNTPGPNAASGSHGLQNLLIHTDKVLGSGSGGTFVFEGEFEGRDVAVKRMLPQFYELASQEVSLLEQSEDHPNVIRYFCRREDQHFLYIALELCQASLWDLFRDGRRDEAPDFKHAALVEEINRDPRKALRQLAEGVKYLHQFRIVHRDIKPQNMLVAYAKKKSLSPYPRLVISDFGLCKTLPDNASTLIGTTGNAGTAGWKAPELISKPKDSTGNSSQHSTNGTEGSSNGLPPQPGAAGVKRAVDIFSLGCVFFYVLTQGQHPFDDEEGWQSLRERNIKNDRANYRELKFLGPDIEDLISWMLSHDPSDRPTAAQVLQHPFFWDAEDRLEFLSAASDRFDQEPRDGTSVILNGLEKRAEQIIPKGINGTAYSAAHSHLRSSSSGNNSTSLLPPSQMALPIPAPDFFAQLDAKFIDTLGRQRKYDPGKLADLLRALRNKHHHWDDMPADVKKKVGAIPEGYLHYWETRFPALVVGVWRVVGSLGISEERRFWKWFGGAKEKV